MTLPAKNPITVAIFPNLDNNPAKNPEIAKANICTGVTITNIPNTNPIEIPVVDTTKTPLLKLKAQIINIHIILVIETPNIEIGFSAQAATVTNIVAPITSSIEKALSLLNSLTTTKLFINIL